MPTNLVEAAESYLKRALSVIPFKRDKSTACIKWTDYQTTRPSLEDAKKWFTTRFKNEFIAIVTGEISNLLVVDCDTVEAYEKIQEFIPEYLVTPTAKSPHGFHLYFKHRSGLVNKANYMPGVDIRTDGGCIIAPPSANGGGLSYQWMPGLSILEVEPAAMPDYLYDTLLQYINSSYYKDYSIANGVPEKKIQPQDTTPTTNGHNLFVSGRRDDDIFHIANCLVKGGCERKYIDEAIRIIAKNCDPPFPESEINLKIESALQRAARRERNLSFEVKEWVDATNGHFSTTTISQELQTTTKLEKKNLNMILKRLSEGKKPLIEKYGDMNGWWRRIEDDCQPVDWLNVDCKYIDLWLPLGLGEVCGVQPGNVLVLAGAKDSGKTAFLMNIAKENRHNYQVHYLNSEMSHEEFKMRCSKFDDVTIDMLYRSIKLYDVTEKFQDRVKPGRGNLNIIDYLEVPEEAYRIGPIIKRIHEKLDGAICVIGIQKKINQDLGRGAEFSMEKARLYLSMDFGKAKIISCKNFKENDIIRGNPRGYTTQYKLVNGCKIIKSQQGWTSPADKEVL